MLQECYSHVAAVLKSWYCHVTDSNVTVMKLFWIILDNAWTMTLRGNCLHSWCKREKQKKRGWTIWSRHLYEKEKEYYSCLLEHTVHSSNFVNQSVIQPTLKLLKCYRSVIVLWIFHIEKYMKCCFQHDRWSKYCK